MAQSPFQTCLDRKASSADVSVTGYGGVVVGRPVVAYRNLTCREQNPEYRLTGVSFGPAQAGESEAGGGSRVWDVALASTMLYCLVRSIYSRGGTGLP